MSGIVGIYSVNRNLTGNDLIEWLYSAEIYGQPRGESGAGVSMVNQWGEIKTEKGLGQVRNAIPIDRLRNTGDPSVYVAIGQTRYAREQYPNIVNTQPIEVETEHYKAAVAADSMLTGWDEMHGWFEYDTELETQTGAEIFGRLFLRELERTRDVEKAGEKFFYNMDGKGIYSILMLLQEKGKKATNLIAITDPHGGKPLCFAEKDGTFFSASGTYPLEQHGIDIRNIKEVNQGSIFKVSDNGLDSYEFKKDKRMRCVFEYIYFDCPYNRALTELGPKFYELLDKYYEQLEISPEAYKKFRETPTAYVIRNILGVCLAETYPELKNEIEIFIPIVQTGTGVTYGLSKVYGISEAPDALIKTGAPRTFQLPDPELRKLEVDLKNAGIAEFISGKYTGSGDDSVVRGGVAGHYSKKKGVLGLFERLGAKALCMLISYSDMAYPCVRGNIPYHRRERMAAEGLEWLPMEAKNKIVGEILGNSLTIPMKLFYQHRDNTYNIFGPDNCFACMDANYPIDERYLEDWIKAQRDMSRMYANKKWV